MKRSKIIIYSIIIVLVSGILPLDAVSANSVHKDSSTITEEEINQIMADNDGLIETNSSKDVRVFVAGLLVGIIVNGYFIAYTNTTPEALVAKVINYNKKNRGCKSIRVTKGGSIGCGHSRPF